MPFLAPGPLPPPPPATGVIPSSVPASVVTGGGMFAATNVMTSQLTSGPEVVGIAAFVTLGTQILKMPAWLDQHRFAVLIVLLLGLIAGMVVYGGDHVKALLNGSSGALQALMNYTSLKSTGLGVLPPATQYPGSEET